MGKKVARPGGRLGRQARLVVLVALGFAGGLGIGYVFLGARPLPLQGVGAQGAPKLPPAGASSGGGGTARWHVTLGPMPSLCVQAPSR